MNKAPVFNLKKLKSYADWKLLIFLLLFLDVKLAVKIFAIAVIYLSQFDFRFGFRLKNSRLPLFYPAIILIGIIGLIVNKDYISHNYIIVCLTGIGFWLMCILSVHQVKLSVDKNETTVIHNTVFLFFIINSAVSVLNYGSIVLETGALNPYTYQGQYQKYFIGTGDYIKGVTFDTCTTNAVLNAFGVVYFLIRNNPLMMMLCMAVLLFTGSNSVNIIILLVLAYIFIFKSSKNQKSLIAICFMLAVFFMGKISPQNGDYAAQVFKNIFNSQKTVAAPPRAKALRITARPDSTLNPEEKREKIATLYIDSLYRDRLKRGLVKINAGQKAAAPKTDAGRIYIEQPNINLPPYQALNSTPPGQAQLVTFIAAHKNLLPLSGKPFHWVRTPGKVTAVLQTINFFKQHPVKIIAGDGIGNFSSKLAFKASGLGVVGGFPSKYTYINPDFLHNHLDLYLDYFSRNAGYHSLINSPYLVYDQLFAEYGLLGLIVFFIGYLWFFVKNIKILTYGLPILLLTIAVLFTDYWFEQLSILIFFELMLLLDIKESSLKLNMKYEY